MNGVLIPRTTLSEHDRSAMFALLDRHFENVSREQFEADLQEKNWAILLRDDRRRLCGFTTMRFASHDLRDGPCDVVSSGDTIVEPGAWGSSMLLRTWLHGVLSLRSRAAGGFDRPCYWLLITSGFRTYRFLPLFWRSFYPRFDEATPLDVQRRMDALARATYGDQYDARSGLVRLTRPQRLRAHLAGIPESRRRDPHIAFFIDRNPGHARGDELVGFTEIDESNLTRAGLRILQSTGGRLDGNLVPA